ncbi:type II toxin-antitoxin system RelE/ParE family toxin [uncultured Rhodoblastus sp.]|jgi:toxin ParE1/3/4|uniref:type II toxin-antitoxin system RelE/ParE family toxin n=1 Tax=uncultured Rhodoblastus sp. TaxID=543037 RepID=UPI0025F876BA|nr:type II toxin-antitoxin system RelE/ParE family toxin [uncultured Rhodoblastus sp.]
MPYHVIFTPEANAHLVGIYRHIATKASPTIAEHFTTAIIDYCEGFTTFPHRGTKRDDLRSGLRTIGFRRCVTVAFTVELDRVTIIGVFYGGQNYEETLQIDD